MRSNVNRSLTAWLQALVLFMIPCQADDQQTCEFSIAALNLPAGSSGLLHWRSAEGATSPLQLSTRYFSAPMSLQGKIIQFFANPVAAKPSPPLPVPLLTLKIPANTKLVYLVLWSDHDEQQQPRWRGRLFSAGDWDMGSIKVLNGCSEPLGMTAGQKRIRLTQAGSVDLHARDWEQPFPVKIFRNESAPKLVFSSTWRIAAGRRELCFVLNVNGAISLRSLLDLAASPPADAS